MPILDWLGWLIWLSQAGSTGVETEVEVAGRADFEAVPYELLLAACIEAEVVADAAAYHDGSAA